MFFLRIGSKLVFPYWFGTRISLSLELRSRDSLCVTHFVTHFVIHYPACDPCDQLWVTDILICVFPVRENFCSTFTILCGLHFFHGMISFPVRENFCSTFTVPCGLCCFTDLCASLSCLCLMRLTLRYRCLDLRISRAGELSRFRAFTDPVSISVSPFHFREA